jgi:hypothetical protein
MIIIKSKCGSIFQGMNEDYMNAEMKLSMAYYKAQGCIVEYVDSFKFGDECNCEDCNQLEHEFEKLIEEIKSE